jgi:alpha-N-arabinofuranosidase
VYNRAWKSPTDNDVGTDEFVALCRLLGAEPYLCVNYGTGSPEEAADWVEYCNGSVETRWGKVRAANGHPEPYDVKYWNIGNELYLPTELGATNGTEYGKGFKRFAQAMRAVDPDIQLVAVGCFDVNQVLATILRFNQTLWPVVRYHVDWTKGLLQEAGGDIDLLAIHYYEPNDVKDADSLDQVNAICMAVSDDLNEKLDELLDNVRKYAPEGKRIPIALDEWATWVNGGPQPPTREGIPANLAIPRDLGLYCAAETMRTALAEAGIMNLLQRRPDDFALGCKTLLYAYLSGEIGVRRDAVVASPCALMMGLYSTHDTCQALQTEVESASFRFQAIRPRPGSAAQREAYCLDASARIHPDGKTVDVFVVNRNLKDDVPCRLEWIGGEVPSDVEVHTLNSADIYDWNTFDKPDTIRIKTQQIPSQGPGLDYSFPAHSVTRLTFRVT